MEFRILQYFLAVAREKSISAAAESLHLSQPTLSRQLLDLEDRLGKKLLIRGNRHVTLTEEGMILRKRAEEILSLVQKATDEILLLDDAISGDVYIGAGETDAVRYLARAAKKLQNQYPNIRIHISSGDTTDVTDNLDRGLIDFGLLFGPIDTQIYDHLTLPMKDIYGVLMRCDSPLAQKEAIMAEDLWDKPLLVNRNTDGNNWLTLWLGKGLSDLNIVATYSLLFNGSLLVEEGVGYALGLDGIINTSGDSGLCFRPLAPSLEVGMRVVWKKYTPLSKPAEKYLQVLREIIQAE